jgi:hypothetical protein
MKVKDNIVMINPKIERAKVFGHNHGTGSSLSPDENGVYSM